MVKKIRVAITAIGSGVGQSIIDAIRLARMPIQTVGLDIQPFAFGAYDCDNFAMMPRWKDPDFVPKMVDLVGKMGIDLLIPGLDNELPILSSVTDKFAHSGTTILIAPSDLVSMTRNKIEWSTSLAAVSGSIIRSWAGSATRALVQKGGIDFPLIAKPVGGSASSGVSIIRDVSDLESIKDSDVVQPFIRPTPDDPNYEAIEKAMKRGELLQASEISVQFVFGRDSRLLGKMASYNRLKNGVPIEIVPVDWPEIWEALDPVVDYLVAHGIAGPVNIQGRLGASGLQFFEMNARFTGITGLRAQMGFNEVATLIDDFSGGRARATAPLVVNPRKVGIRQVLARTVDHSANEALLSKTERIRRESMTSRRVVITGATGWLGRHLVQALAETEEYSSVVALVRAESRASEVFQAHGSTRVEIIEWDGICVDRWNPGNADLLIHLAGARPPHGAEAIQRSARFNLQVADVVARFQIPEVVYASSHSVYGDQPGPWFESAIPAPESAYGLMKLSGEMAFELAQERSPTTNVSVIRLGRLFGDADGTRWEELPHRIAHDFGSGNGKAATPGGPVYDLLDLEDVVSAISRVLTLGVPKGFNVFNCGRGTAVTIQELVASAEKLSTGSYSSAGDHDTTALRGQTTNQVMDSSLFQRTFDWSPNISLESTMAALIKEASRSES